MLFHVSNSTVSAEQDLEHQTHLLFKRKKCCRSPSYLKQAHDINRQKISTPTAIIKNLEYWKKKVI